MGWSRVQGGRRCSLPACSSSQVWQGSAGRRRLEWLQSSLLLPSCQCTATWRTATWRTAASPLDWKPSPLAGCWVHHPFLLCVHKFKALGGAALWGAQVQVQGQEQALAKAGVGGRRRCMVPAKRAWQACMCGADPRCPQQAGRMPQSIRSGMAPKTTAVSNMLMLPRPAAGGWLRCRPHSPLGW